MACKRSRVQAPPAPPFSYQHTSGDNGRLKQFKAILIIGAIEILIGGTTLLGTIATLVFSVNTKPPNVLLFVVCTGMISALIGIGLVRFQKGAYQLLLYFSSIVLLSKALIFLEIIHLSGALETTVPSPIKNIISCVYHAGVIYYLKKENIQAIFHR